MVKQFRFELYRKLCEKDSSRCNGWKKQDDADAMAESEQRSPSADQRDREQQIRQIGQPDAFSGLGIGGSVRSLLGAHPQAIVVLI